MKVFTSDDGVDLFKSNDELAESLMHPKDPYAWKEVLGTEEGLRGFFAKGEPLEIADYLTPEEVETQNRIMNKGYHGVFNWCVAWRNPHLFFLPLAVKQLLTRRSIATSR